MADKQVFFLIAHIFVISITWSYEIAVEKITKILMFDYFVGFTVIKL